MKPIFIFSLPRSGSTFLQRMLESSDLVAGKGEPWILLPLVYQFKVGGLYSEYGHKIALAGINDISGGLNSDVSRKAIKAYCLEMYKSNMGSGQEYFVDKTPRYSLISDEIIKIFGDDAVYIYLWRNPLDVINSMCRTFSNGAFRVHPFDIDLHKGLDNMMSSYEENMNRKNVLSFSYEEISGSHKYVEEVIYNSLGLKINPNNISGRSGVLGDPTPGKRTSDNFSTSFVGKWWIARYLRKIPEFPGFERDATLRRLSKNSVGMQGIPGDVFWLIVLVLIRFFDVYPKYLKFKKVFKGEKVYKSS